MLSKDWFKSARVLQAKKYQKRLWLKASPAFSPPRPEVSLELIGEATVMSEPRGHCWGHRRGCCRGWRGPWSHPQPKNVFDCFLSLHLFESLFCCCFCCCCCCFDRVHSWVTALFCNLGYNLSKKYLLLFWLERGEGERGKKSTKGKKESLR